MEVYDKSGNRLDHWDEESGRVDQRVRRVTHRWVVDSPEESELRVVKSYPGGGRDVERVITSPEIGHWVTTEEGREVDWDRPIPDDWKRHGEVSEEVPYGVLIEYTEGERAYREFQSGVKIIEFEEVIAATDEALCELYEQSLGRDAIIDDQDAAICALYEMIGE